MKAKKAVSEESPDSIHEAAFVTAFVIPDKRSRYLEFLPNPNRRGQMLQRWNHFFDFIPECATQIPRTSVFELARALRHYGAGRFGYVMGAGNNDDGRTFTLEEGIARALISGWGTVVSCVPGRLALYFQEYPPGDVFILRPLSRSG